MHRGVALFGFNIPYSISPLIHNTAFKAAELPYTYIPFDVAPERLARAVDAIATLDFAGANVTIPYKETVIGHASVLTDTARQIGAVNTLVIERGAITGHNTDADGFYNAYREDLNLLQNETVLILGAGGAARAVCHALIARVGVQRLIIANRTGERAGELAGHLRNAYGYEATEVITGTARELAGAGSAARGIVQTTPVGSNSAANRSKNSYPGRFQKDQVAIDLIYSPLETPFLQLAVHAGARTHNGIAMLLHQAALSFTLWTGAAFPMETVSSAVKEHIKQQMKKAGQ
jgi:shikimate dehydrogenase